MTSKRAFTIMLLFTSLTGILLVGSIIVGNSLLQHKADSLLSSKIKIKVLDEQQQALLKAKQELSRYADLEQTAAAVVPQDKDQAKTVREIIKIADDAAVPISSVTFPSSTLGQKGSQKNAKVSQAKPVAGMTGVFQIPINIQSNLDQPTPYANLIDFLQKLEQNRRTAQVSEINVQPYPKDPSKITFTITINVFVKP